MTTTTLDSPATRPGSGDGLRIGPYRVWPPVVLAPMAGITNAAFRTLCRDELADGLAASVRGAARSGGPEETAAPGIFVCEMVTTRALVERNERTLAMIRFAEHERPRSLQLYGVDPRYVGEAVAMVAAEDLADHVDLNFGCPVPKVTRRGGGAALPYHRALFRDVVSAAVRGAGGALPVTVKMRVGIDDDHPTYLEAGRIAEGEGAATVALHGRTAAQAYSGTADWSAIARLKEALSVPVLGNGDIWEADDARRMMAETGCDGVVIGRGCLGRPWLFRDLAAAFSGSADRLRPTLGEVAAVMHRHAAALVRWLDGPTTAAELPHGPHRGVIEFRKHVAWYLKGFAVGTDLRRGLAAASSLAELATLLGRLDHEQPWPEAGASGPRGRAGSPRRVVLPDGWLDDPDDPAPPCGAELADSGG